MINLIPISYLNEACFLSLNSDEKKYNMCLKVAQDDLKDIVGPEFYTQIETQYNGDSLSSDNDALYEGYIKDYLAWQTYLVYLGFANVDSTPTGIRVQNDDNSSIASDINMYSLEKNVKNQAVRYKNRMINFLNESQANTSSKYPLWMKKCKEEMSFSITAIDKKSDALIKVNKALNTNE